MIYIKISLEALERVAESRPKGYLRRIKQMAVEVTDTHVKLKKPDYDRLKQQYTGKTAPNFIPVQKRKRPTTKQVKNFAKAAITGKYVDPAVMAERLAICERCDKVRESPNGVKWCGVCGCKVAKEGKKIFNLAAYEETFNSKGKALTGCKHPRRGQKRDDGTLFGWPLPGNSDKTETE